MNKDTQIRNRNYKKVMYNFSERFHNLRRSRDNTDKANFIKMSSDIESVTGVKISHTQLRKYYNLCVDEDEQIDLFPNIKNLLALADYYGVSLEYMLALSDSTSYKNKYKVGSKGFGLNDISMKILEDMKDTSHVFNVPSKNDDIYKKFSGADFINFFITNLLDKLCDYCNRYFYELQRLEKLEYMYKENKINIEEIRESIELKKSIEEEINTSKYLVNYRKSQMFQILEDFVDDLRQELKKRVNEKEID